MEHHFKNFSVLENLKKEKVSASDRDEQCKYVRFDKTIAADALRFHKSIPGFGVTPLVSLQEWAAAGKVKAVYCKDESFRFGLNAFKGLGGSYAMFRILCQRLGLDHTVTDYRDFQKKEIREQCNKVHFVTATDGNHGKGASWAAKLFGCSATVFMPAGSVEARRKAIEEAGNATAEITNLNYDQAVEHSWNLARQNGWILIQDTAWDGYEQYPEWIIDGYLTMAAEAVEQLQDIVPTHVFLQAGVGAMAGGVMEFLFSCYRKNQLAATEEKTPAGLQRLERANNTLLKNGYQDKKPFITIVEPKEAACIYQSVKAGDGMIHSIEGNPVTIMAGLNCGTPCRVTWPAIRDKAAFFCSCEDIITKEGMRTYANPSGNDGPVVSGESGAVTFGLVNRILQDETLRRLFHIREDSVILLFNTEGDTDPEGYRKIICETKCEAPYAC
ncbi:MAG: diaminopropionate ammonia-lyase [Acidaminococcaceae bacterium]|nr:diaminopropionate ammonia-lyase [Acidaminococcaceae bacterium]